MSWAIDPMRPADAASLEAVDPEWDEETAVSFLGRPATAGVVARGPGRAVVGFVIGQVAGGEAEIVQITVAGPARGQGIGSALLGAFLAAHAGKACFLEVRKDNAPAIALYRRHGFTPEFVRKDYYRGPEGSADAVVMRLDTPGAPD